MMKNVKAQTREEAVALGQMLMLRGYIRHVSNQPFMDANAFYTFVSHEKEREEYAEPTAKELKAIATAMQHPTRGIELKDRRDFLFSFQDTFTGIEAKIWMEKYLSSKNYYLYSAEQILETLKDRGVFYACNKKLGPFKPDKEIYAFFSVPLFLKFVFLFSLNHYFRANTKFLKVPMQNHLRLSVVIVFMALNKL